MKIVLNKCYGGFCVSSKVYEKMGVEYDGYGYRFNEEGFRTNPKFIEAIETIGEKESSGKYARLMIVEIPDDITDWRINEYDGYESVTYVQNGIIKEA